ncbi:MULTISPECIES: helix-turn-helix domain-containing protein [Microvirga]|uniref:Putative transcriptional regulator with C-terminal CBS domains n=1 Tax=Microvirga lotononidis TaxID=864069 RepID=I4Z493_9HYPH|nr:MULTISPECIES: helix-turn-helix transcriptional regulator [Microvirga]EIM31035.1 putative transcriptional regulator with C-terminal CBS domains [Microvirga lotononidis]WQO30110.1 helix-turn-helix transcriptional regulator [Microvirga lotononidis]
MPAVGEIARALKDARANKGLSQATLGGLVGLPQSHISKIESGAVDLQLSSLIELARVLDLDVRLVPRKALPAVDSVVRTTAPSAEAEQQARLHNNLRRIAEASGELSRLHLLPDAERLADAANLLQKVTIPREEIARVQKAVEQLKPLQHLPIHTKNYEALARQLQDPGLQSAIRSAAQALRSVRNHIAHSPAAVKPAVRPAYALDEEDDDA